MLKLWYDTRGEGGGVPVQRIIERLKISPAVFNNNCAGFIAPWLQ